MPNILRYKKTRTARVNIEVEGQIKEKRKKFSKQLYGKFSRHVGSCSQITLVNVNSGDIRVLNGQLEQQKSCDQFRPEKNFRRYF